MDIETYNQLSKNISELVEETRKRHQQSYYVQFRVKYYALVNGKVVESPVSGIFKNCQWGCIQLYYFGGDFEAGYPRESELCYIVTPEGYLSEYMTLGNLKISFSYSYSYMEIKTQDDKYLYSAKAEKVGDAMEEILHLVPLLQGCRSAEEAKMIVEISANNQEVNQREDMVNILMNEIKKLRSTISDYERIFEEIRSKLPEK